MKEKASSNFTDYKLPENFYRVVVGFDYDTEPKFNGIAFYDKQGNNLLSVGST